MNYLVNNKIEILKNLVNNKINYYSRDILSNQMSVRGGSKIAAPSKMERFVIIVNGFQSLTIITKSSILDVAAVLDPPLSVMLLYEHKYFQKIQLMQSAENVKKWKF